MIHVICRGNNKVLYIVNVVFLLFVIYYLTSNRQKQSYKIFIWAINSSFVIKQRIKNELCTITKYNKNVDIIEISAHDGQLPALIYRHCHITSLLFYHFQLIQIFCSSILMIPWLNTGNSSEDFNWVRVARSFPFCNIQPKWHIFFSYFV